MPNVTDIIPPLPIERGTVTLSTGGMPKSRAEIVSEGQMPGVETLLQKLLEVRGEIGGPDKAKAEREAPVREFHGAPITYDGFANVQRRPPAQSILLIIA